MSDWTQSESMHVEHYKRATAQMTYYADRMRDSFKLFIQLTIAVIGGFVWLKIHSKQPPAELLVWARWIVLFFAVVLSLQIVFDQRNWRRYRWQEHWLRPQSSVWGRSPNDSRDLTTKIEQMAWQEITMILSMCASGTICALVLQ